MEYQIFNKETHEYITTYYNYETLKTLDTSRCYYVAVKKQKSVELSKKEESKRSVSNTPTTQQDILSIAHPIGISLYSTVWSSSGNTNSNSCDNSSVSSYSSNDSNSSSSDSSSCSSYSDSSSY